MTTENFTKRNYGDHTRFGGLIYNYDFDTEHRLCDGNGGSSIARRIASDWRFDNQCLQSIEARKRRKEYQELCKN